MRMRSPGRAAFTAAWIVRYVPCRPGHRPTWSTCPEPPAGPPAAGEGCLAGPALQALARTAMHVSSAAPAAAPRRRPGRPPVHAPAATRLLRRRLVIAGRTRRQPRNAATPAMAGPLPSSTPTPKPVLTGNPPAWPRVPDRSREAPIAADQYCAVDLVVVVLAQGRRQGFVGVGQRIVAQAGEFEAGIIALGGDAGHPPGDLLA